jgi:LysM repeat protein
VDLSTLITPRLKEKRAMDGNCTLWRGWTAKLVGHWLSGLAIGLALSLVLLPPLAVTAQSTPTPGETTEGFTHTVGVGESWSVIADRYGVTTRVLKAANPALVRYNDVLRVGDQMVIPGVEPATPTATPTFGEYVVQPGDGWSNIAEKFDVRLRDLLAANPDLIRYDYILYTGDRVRIPQTAGATPAADTTSTTEAATATEAPTETAEPSATATIAAADTPVATETPAAPTTSAITETGTAATATVAPVAEGCPANFAGYPAQINAVLNAPNGGAEAVSSFLQECGAQIENGVQIGDWTGDGVSDFVIIYSNPAQADGARQTDLIIFNGSDGGFVEAYRAKAAGEVTLFALSDINSDGQPDLAWVDRTCGASTCFDTVEVLSWDGSQWRDWTEDSITMAYAEVTLAEQSPDGQGEEIVLDGGVYGSVGAGPQRSRTEVWGSIAGAPYRLLDRTYAASSCLYHTVLDANEALLEGTAEGFARAEQLYTQAATDQTLEQCWLRDDELEELRSFSLFRLALVSAYQGKSGAAADIIGGLTTSYPGSLYDQVGQIWLAAYAQANDIGTACSAANQFATDNPAVYEILADYGYANPTFAAGDVCPVLDLETLPTPEVISPTVPITATVPVTRVEAITTVDPLTPSAVVTAPMAEAAAGAVSDAEPPACPADLSGYAALLPDVLAVAGGDELILEMWLRQCEAMADDRGGFRLLDANSDGQGDAIFWPTVISELGFGPDGAQGAFLIYHGDGAGSYTLAVDEEIYGQPTLLASEDLNGDGQLDLAWQVVGCSASCVLQVQIVTWDGEDYASIITPGAAIAQGLAAFEPVPEGDPGRGQQLVLGGGVTDTSEGGVAVAHIERWQSVDGQPFARIDWRYDRAAPGNDCMGLRLVEADVALQASPVLGYGPAIERYQAAIDPSLQACSIFGLAAQEELVLLQGLATFRLIQAQALSGDLAAARTTLQALTSGQPESDYTQIATDWLAAYEAEEDPAAACAAVESRIAGNDLLWQITDHFGINHPALAAEQICYQP